MPQVRLEISMSLDGYTSGPDQTLEEPLGRRGEELHEWVFGLRAWRQEHGMEGGEDNASTAVMERSLANRGVTIMGRNMFGGRGEWGDEPWNGWWGDNPPYHHPVFVVTHHAREPLVMEGGTTFHFVTEGIEAALAQGREAAGDQDVFIAGGATICNEYLAAGLVDEVLLHVSPVILGGGERLFEGVGDLRLEQVEAIEAPGVTHLRYRTVR
jgi:dihydrofolate reductase